MLIGTVISFYTAEEKKLVVQLIVVISTPTNQAQTNISFARKTFYIKNNFHFFEFPAT